MLRSPMRASESVPNLDDSGMRFFRQVSVALRPPPQPLTCRTVAEPVPDRSRQVPEFLPVERARPAGHEPEPERGGKDDVQDRGDDDEQARRDVWGGREDRVEVPGEEGEREDGCGEGEGDPQRREGDEREPLRVR